MKNHKGGKNMYLKFIDDNNIYPLKEDYDILYTQNKITFYQNDIPANTNGFEIYSDEGLILASYFDYNIVFGQTDNFIIFASEAQMHYIYYIFDEDKYINSYVITTKESNKNNYILARKGIGMNYEEVSLSEIFNENGYPIYKVIEKDVFDDNNFFIVDVEKILEFTTEEDYVYIDNKKLQKTKEQKIEILSNICEANIINGIDYNNKHFSYGLTDQNNLYNAVQLSLATGLAAPFHADNETCKLYSQEDIVAIYIAQQTNLTHNSTYYNQLKLYIESLIDVEEVNAVYYGQELTGEYLDKYNEIMSQAQLITSAFIGQQNL
jgi:hypothetical protein